MSYVLVRGGGDLGTGVVIRLRRAGLPTLITELPQPLAVRRMVSFSEAVYERTWTVEDVTARLVRSLDDAFAVLREGDVPVLVEPALAAFTDAPPVVMIDARLTKREPDADLDAAPLVVGLGPGFTAGRDSHAVVETKRGHTLGRVYWAGAALADTGQPEGDPRRVLRAPASGEMLAYASIGDVVRSGQLLAEVAGRRVTCPFDGVLRGLIRPGLSVPAGVKVGDVDASGIREHCFLVSDKALAVGGGVLEAILSRPDLRTLFSN